MTTCLNPFEIRGGLKPLLSYEAVSQLCLNPFEIKGGLKQSQIVKQLAEELS